MCASCATVSSARSRLRSASGSCPAISSRNSGTKSSTASRAFYRSPPFATQPSGGRSSGRFESSGGQIAEAAARLGISRTTMWEKMRRHGIEVGSDPATLGFPNTRNVLRSAFRTGGVNRASKVIDCSTTSRPSAFGTRRATSIPKSERMEGHAHETVRSACRRWTSALSVRGRHGCCGRRRVDRSAGAAGRRASANGAGRPTPRRSSPTSRT